MPLSDNEIHGLLVAAGEALGREPGATVRGDTAIKAARRALVLLQFGLVAAMEQNSDTVPGIIPPEPSLGQ